MTNSIQITEANTNVTFTLSFFTSTDGGATLTPYYDIDTNYTEIYQPENIYHYSGRTFIISAVKTPDVYLTFTRDTTSMASGVNLFSSSGCFTSTTENFVSFYEQSSYNQSSFSIVESFTYPLGVHSETVHIGNYYSDPMMTPQGWVGILTPFCFPGILRHEVGFYIRVLTDTTPPVCEISADSTTQYVSGNTVYTNTPNVDLFVTYSDADSPIALGDFIVNGSSYIYPVNASGETNASYTLNLTGTSPFEVEFNVTDQAGNSNTSNKINVVYDPIPPTGTINISTLQPTHSYSGNTYANTSNIVLRLTHSDADSGLF